MEHTGTTTRFTEGAPSFNTISSSVTTSAQESDSLFDGVDTTFSANEVIPLEGIENDVLNELDIGKIASSANINVNVIDTSAEQTTHHEGVVNVHHNSESLQSLAGYDSDCSNETLLNSIEEVNSPQLDESNVESLYEQDDIGDEDVDLSQHGFNSLDEMLKTLGELSIDKRPVLDKSEVSIDKEQIELLGTVSSILGKLVIVQSSPNKPVFNVDTLLFLDGGAKPLGYIFDIMGPVSNPLYAIQFNSSEEIEALVVKPGMNVYCAPDTNYAKHLLVMPLFKQKGSDASWKNDMEVPPEMIDYSDDEAEFGTGSLLQNRKRTLHERHLEFEQDMNIRNLLDSRMHGQLNQSQNRRTNRKSQQGSSGGGYYDARNGRGRGLLGIVGALPTPCRGYVPSSMPGPNFQPTLSSTVLAPVAPSAYPHTSYNVPVTYPPMHHTPYAPVFVPALPQLPFNTPPPLPQVYGNASPHVKTGTPGAMVYPPDMGLPAVQPLVPNLPYFGGPLVWNNYATPPPPPPPGQPPTTTTASSFNGTRR